MKNIIVGAILLLVGMGNIHPSATPVSAFHPAGAKSISSKSGGQKPRISPKTAPIQIIAHPLTPVTEIAEVRSPQESPVMQTEGLPQTEFAPIQDSSPAAAMADVHLTTHENDPNAVPETPEQYIQEVHGTPNNLPRGAARAAVIYHQQAPVTRAVLVEDQEPSVLDLATDFVEGHSQSSQQSHLMPAIKARAIRTSRAQEQQRSRNTRNSRLAVPNARTGEFVDKKGMLLDGNESQNTSGKSNAPSIISPREGISDPVLVYSEGSKIREENEQAQRLETAHLMIINRAVNGLKKRYLRYIKDTPVEIKNNALKTKSNEIKNDPVKARAEIKDFIRIMFQEEYLGILKVYEKNLQKKTLEEFGIKMNSDWNDIIQATGKGCCVIL